VRGGLSPSPAGYEAILKRTTVCVEQVSPMSRLCALIPTTDFMMGSSLSIKVVSLCPKSVAHCPL